MSENQSERLAIEGGRPVRAEPLPYACPWLDETDRQAVLEALGQDLITTGPRVAEFEDKFAAAVGAKHAVAVSSGTAALHAAAYAAGLGAGQEVIVADISFVAS